MTTAERERESEFEERESEFENVIHVYVHVHTQEVQIQDPGHQGKECRPARPGCQDLHDHDRQEVRDLKEEAED